MSRRCVCKRRWTGKPLRQVSRSTCTPVPLAPAGTGAFPLPSLHTCKGRRPWPLPEDPVCQPRPLPSSPPSHTLPDTLARMAGGRLTEGATQPRTSRAWVSDCWGWVWPDTTHRPVAEHGRFADGGFCNRPAAVRSFARGVFGHCRQWLCLASGGALLLEGIVPPSPSPAAASRPTTPVTTAHHLRLAFPLYDHILVSVVARDRIPHPLPSARFCLSPTLPCG